MTQDERQSAILALFDEIYDTLEAKGRAYPPKADAFGNFERYSIAGISVEQGILTRIIDKVSRLGNLIQQGRTAGDESTADTATDLVGYAALLAVWLKTLDEGKKKGKVRQ